MNFTRSYSSTLMMKALGLCLRWVVFLTVLLVVAISNAAGATGEIFWGSFGEGSGRVECAIFKGETVSEVLGYDAETETGFYSTDMNWNEGELFDFQGVAIRSNNLISALGNGASLNALESETVLTGMIEDEALEFETFSSESGRYHVLELLGQTRANLRIAEGDQGNCFVLYTDDRGMAYGRLVERSDEGVIEFLTPSGDVFIAVVEDGVVVEGSYSLVDGRRGVLAANESESYVESVWLVDSSREEQESSSMHFILDGEGEKAVCLNASVSVLGGALGEVELPSVKAVVSLLGAGGSFEEIVAFEEFEVVELDGAFQLSGRFETKLLAGTYLVRLEGLYAFETVSEIEVEFLDEFGPVVINASALYQTGQVEEGHSFGFSLGGEGNGKAMIRNVGPSLSQFDLPSYTSDPRMAIYKNASKAWKNDDWSDSVAPEQLSAEMTVLGAFELEAGSKDAVVELTLEAGAYEVVPQGGQKETSFESVEVYFQ